MTVVTIASLEGGGGVELGLMVAQRLGYDYVDRLVLAQAARHAGATVEALYQKEERPPTLGERFARFLRQAMAQAAASEAGADPYFGPGSLAFLTEQYEEMPQPTSTKGHEVEDDKYIEAIRHVMNDLADRDNVVIVGRGGPVILKERPGVLLVGVVSDYKDRVTRIMDRQRLSREEAEKVISARDRARAYFMRRFFKIDDPMNPMLYHLMVNISDVNIQYAADMVTNACNALESSKLTAKV